MKLSAKIRLLRFWVISLVLLICGTSLRLCGEIDILSGGELHPNTTRQNKYNTGSSITLKLRNPESYPNSNFQWFHDGQPISGAIQIQLEFSALSSADTGNYWFVATSDLRTKRSESTVTLNVTSLPPSSADSTFSAVRLPEETSHRHIIGFLQDGSILATYYTASERRVVQMNTEGETLTTFSFPESFGKVLSITKNDQLIVSRFPYLIDAEGNAPAFTLPTSLDPDLPLIDGRSTSNGDLYLAQRNRVVRCSAQGILDTTFEFGVQEEAEIKRIYVDSRDRIYITHTRERWFTLQERWWGEYCFRATSDGSPDPSFTPIEAEDYYVSATKIYLTELNDGRILANRTIDGFSEVRVISEDENGEPDSITPQNIGAFRVVVDPANNRVYGWSEDFVRYNIVANNLVKDESFYSGYRKISYPNLVHFDSQGALYIEHEAADWEGHNSHGLVRLRPDASAPSGQTPEVTLHSNSPSLLAKGHQLTVSSTTSGTGPFSYQWLALDGQTLPLDSTSSELQFEDFSKEDLGRYQLRVTNTLGVTLSTVLRLNADRRPPFLANLSARAAAGKGERTMIAGFKTKNRGGPVLIRGLGPALKEFGLTQPLSDPEILLHNLAGEVDERNDNWSSDPTKTDDLRHYAQKIGAVPIPEGSADAALLTHLDPAGQRTVHLRGSNEDPAAALLEIYDIPFRSSHSIRELENLSLRANTGKSDATMIAGFVIDDPQNFDRTAWLLLRGIGPALADHGIANWVSSPVLRLHDATGRIIKESRSWSDETDASQIGGLSAELGAFPLPVNSKNAAMIVELPPGAYTLSLESAGGNDGVALIEIYRIPY